MAWLDTRPTSHVEYQWLTQFEVDGTRLPLIDRQRGIRKPAVLNAALSIRTTFTPDDQPPPYADDMGVDGLQRYKYRGTDPDHAENRALRAAFEQQLPIIWFLGIAKATFEPIYPVWVIADDRKKLEFTLAVDTSQRLLTPGTSDPELRRYAERVTRQRLHQPIFRSRVLHAYGGKCSICRLKHSELLDAAHIIGDREPGGDPVVPNGISLCKIHHAAFDHGILGIRPDLTIHTREDILEEVDGWMLRGGIQDVHNRRLEILPSEQKSMPDPARLERRYAEFLSA